MGVNTHQGSPQDSQAGEKTPTVSQGSSAQPGPGPRGAVLGWLKSPKNHRVTAELPWNWGVESPGGSVMDHGHHSCLLQNSSVLQIASDSCRSPSCTKALMSWVQVRDGTKCFTWDMAHLGKPILALSHLLQGPGAAPQCHILLGRTWWRGLYLGAEQTEIFGMICY